MMPVMGACYQAIWHRSACPSRRPTLKGCMEPLECDVTISQLQLVVAVSVNGDEIGSSDKR
jgi:hypothetical protein